MEQINKTMTQFENEIKFDTCQGPGYNFSCLVTKFHSLTRYGYNFKPQDVSLLEDQKEYASAIIMYAIMGGIVAIGLTLSLFVFCCCNCMFRSPKLAKRARKPTSRGAVVTCNILVILGAIICAGTFGIGFYGQRRLDKGAGNMCDTVAKVHETIENITKETDIIAEDIDLTERLYELETNIENIQRSVEAIEEIVTSGLLPPLPDTAEFKKYFDKIKTNIDSSTTTVKDQLRDNVIKNIVPTLKTVKEDCPKYSNYAKYGILAALIVFVVGSLIFIVGFCHQCLRITTGVIGYLFFALSMVLGLLFFIALVAGSDACLTAKDLIHKEIDQPILLYYLDCRKNATDITIDVTSTPRKSLVPHFATPPSHDLNKDLKEGNIEELFNHAKELISYAKNSVKQFNDKIYETNENLCQNLNQFRKIPVVANELNNICSNITSIQDNLSVDKEDSLGSRIDSILKAVTQVLGTVDCTNITPMINNSLTNICQNVYDSLYLFLINFVVATIMYFLLIVMNIWLLYSD